ncbi:hypothetical protein ACOME3_005988 [Neoechinorhynchus agilis]
MSMRRLLDQYKELQTDGDNSNLDLTYRFSYHSAARISGSLELRLIGCQDLLDDQAVKSGKSLGEHLTTTSTSCTNLTAANDADSMNVKRQEDPKRNRRRSSLFHIRSWKSARRTPSNASSSSSPSSRVGNILNKLERMNIFGSYTRSGNSLASLVSKSSDIDHSQSPICMVRVLIDGKLKAQTPWRPMSQHAWDRRYTISLKANRMLEFNVLTNAYNSCNEDKISAIKYINLEDFAHGTEHLGGMAISLEPKGLLFIAIRFIPASLVADIVGGGADMRRNIVRLSRQHKLFSKRKGKNVTRCADANMDLLTWTRLIIRGVIPPPTPPQHADEMVVSELVDAERRKRRQREEEQKQAFDSTG